MSKRAAAALCFLGSLVLAVSEGRTAAVPQGAPAGAARSRQAASAGRTASADRRTSFDADWRFLKQDADGAERPDFDDSGWRRLDVPHDWAIEGPFEQRFNPSAGALPAFGVGWYRKHFTLPPGAPDRRVSIEFDGAMSNARVWVNGHDLGSRPYGYASFGFDMTPYLDPRGSNVVAVRLSPEEHSSRWYPGAGIYRHVWLVTTGPVHVARWGTFVTTPEVSDAKATVSVRTEVVNDGAVDAAFTVNTTILDAAGNAVARGTSEPASAAPGASGTVTTTIPVVGPRLWDVDRPVLYRAVSTVVSGGRTVDRVVTRFGIRTIAFDSRTGFSLNGRVLKLHGVCMHLDLGALGTAVYRRALERQLQILKAMGTNAIRTSHNPPAPELLDLADELGLVVMDEAFDMWNKPKVPNGHAKFFAEWGERDLRDMIRRDRNHPSIVLWSIGNEVLEQADPDGAAIARRLTAICHEEDRSRPVTAGFNQFDNAIRNKLTDEVDVVGFNYQPWHYAQVVRDHPNWIVIGSETASTVSSRGIYHLPIEKYAKHPSHEISSYDVITASWAYVPDVEFLAQEQSPSVAGEFVWTGFDYLGEPTPYYDWKSPNDPADWPARSSYFGIVDLAGFPKDRYYLYQSVWTSTPMVHLLPHWNWEGREGESIPVIAYTNAERVELFLNGTSLGVQARGEKPMVIPVGPNVNDKGTLATRYRIRWDVPYAPGTLRAVATTNGKVVATAEVRTAGTPARVKLVADRTRLTADGSDLSFITVRVEDEKGTLCPNASNMIRFTVDGAGTIAAVDNGDPATLEPFQADRHSAFHGLALLVVRTKRGVAGPITVTASSDGLAAGKVALLGGGNENQ